MRNLVIVAAATLAAAASFAHAARPEQVGRGQSAYVERGAPANGADNCADAPGITGFGNFTFDNTFATTDGQDHGLCAKDGDPGIALDLWWRWTSPVSGPVTISTCGLTDVDTEIAIYAPNAICAPGDEALIFCDDQNCLNQTEITFLATVGQEYLFRIGSYDGFAVGGPGEFNISGQISPCQPAICQPYDVAFNDGLRSDNVVAVADDFVAPANSLLTFVCVKGDYNNASPFPGATNLTVRYLADNMGVPGLVIASFDAGSGLAFEGPVDTGDTVFGYPQFGYKITHPSVPVAAGQRVWVEVRNVATNWLWSIGTGGNSLSYQTTDSVYSANEATVWDMTFCVGPFETCPTDINNDGFSNFADLNILLNSFNSVCP